MSCVCIYITLYYNWEVVTDPGFVFTTAVQRSETVGGAESH